MQNAMPHRSWHMHLHKSVYLKFEYENIQANILEHWILAEFVDNSAKWYAQYTIDDMHITIHLGNVRLDDSSIHASTFHCYRLIAFTICDHIEIQVSSVGRCWELENLQRKRCITMFNVCLSRNKSWLFYMQVCIIIFFYLPNVRCLA